MHVTWLDGRVGKEAKLRYFANVRLALAPVDERNVFKPVQSQLVITVHLLYIDMNGVVTHSIAQRPHGRD